MLAARLCGMRLCSSTGRMLMLAPRIQQQQISREFLTRASNSMHSPMQQMRSMGNTAPAENLKFSKEADRLLPVHALKSDQLGGGGDIGNQGGGNGDGNGGGSNGEGQGDAHAARPLNPILAWYMKCLEEKPVLTKAITSALLTFVGDLFTQFVIEKSGALDLKRIAVITSLGFMLVGPTLHFWYLALSKLVKVGGPKGAFIRLLLDQLLFSPAFIAIFFVSLLVMEGRPADIGPKLSQDWPSAVLTNWKLWVPFQFINFLFVPQQLQVAFANVIALVWNAYLSFATHTHVEIATDKP